MGERDDNTERPWETKSNKLLILAQRTAPRESRRTAHRSLGNGISGLSVQLSCLARFCHSLTAFTNNLLSLQACFFRLLALPEYMEGAPFALAI